ncbi:MAG: RlpA-like double-psi beta-barrel domain-containing protein, partial [Rhodospirillaceae bacterium]
KTLPMPCLVRVTNLDNGRSIVVRLNDRGPFVAGRIIDMSHRSSKLLGFDSVGTAKVRVQILANESRAIAAAALSNTPTGLSGLGGFAPAPAAAPSGRIEVAGLPVPVAPVPRPPVAAPNTIPGDTKGGRFLPAAVVGHQPVTGTRLIYVQAGAFTQYKNASRLKDRVVGIAPTTISQTQVGGVAYYRVRLGPIGSIEQADGILSRVVNVGSNEARMIVD